MERPNFTAARITFVCFLAHALFLALAYLGPDSGALPLFDSDSAIVVLMSNDPTIDLFRAYYYGQDRFGALPFLLANVARRIMDTHWTPESLAVLRTIWLFTTLGFLALLARPWGLIASAGFLSIVLASPNVRTYLFELTQLYPWAVPIFFCAWWQLRRQCDRPWSSSKVVAGVFAAFLALWMASSFVVLLLAAVAAETLRSGLWRRGQERLQNRSRLWLVTPFLSVTAGMSLELLLRSAYHQYAGSAIGHSYRTPLALDFRHLADNVLSVLRHLAGSPSIMLLALGVIAGLWAGARLLSAKRASDADDHGMLALAFGCTAGALGQIVLLVSVAHFRLNLLHARYFTMVELFLAMSAFLAAMVWIRRFIPAARAGVVNVLIVITLWCVAAFALGRPSVNPKYQDLKTRAHLVGEHGPGTIYLADYWESYVLSGIDPRAEIQAIPLEGQYIRTLWTLRELKPGKEIVVNTSHLPGPPKSMKHYGAVLHLTQSEWRMMDGARFSLYRVVSKSDWSTRELQRGK